MLIHNVWRCIIITTCGVEGVGENEYEGGVKDRQKEHVRKNEAERKCA